MNIAEGIDTGREYFWKRTDGWDWFGTPRWWEVFVEFSGLNGAGGAWLVERWRWNGSSETLREQIRTLSAEDTADVIKAIRERATSTASGDRT